MILMTISLLIQIGEAPAISTTETSTASPEVSTSIEKEVVYQKITNIDLNGAKVEGEKSLPQEFFLYNVKAPRIKNFLEDRLKFSLRDFNNLGY